METIILTEIADKLGQVITLLEMQNQLLAENQQWRDKFADEISRCLQKLQNQTGLPWDASH